MGLDSVEFVLTLEETFGFAIPDEDAQSLMTPGHVVRYLQSRLAAGQGACLEQRAFHSLRRAAMAVLNHPRSAFRPDSEWSALLPRRGRRRAWKLLHHSTGVAPWPPMWLWGALPARYATMGQTARYLATYAAASFQAPGVGWSQAQIEATVRGVISEQLGIDAFDWNQRFVDDLGVD